ncbi:Very-long-chain (3R)-3-hydroxyacyl-CoA dehydratase [Spironucleus salmonicida]|uniref:very-long-chain (3R)-3-hydroxyacyl-CoA dehydratase n=1 Tax=Spironucleus salmonicida TaxID=348837 RepID=V6M2E3_9EUKA|nr:Very-long-chain (3R)-3-hydroxyacyl-CoA dehydratase [Spironucleus salmonicida]|eukprot:EST47409.1 Protein tyrosine phosphatase-like protein [Spironucleus salmonicida]
MKLKSLYLALYNRVNVIGWLIIFFMNLTNPIQCCKILTFFQLFMVMDVLHAILKFTSSKPLIVFIQIASRVYLIAIFAQNYPIYCIFWRLMVGAWASAEVVRYQYYSFQTLKWLRYSAFLLLYPIGVFFGEIPLIYQHFQRQFNVLDLIALLIYVPGFPLLFKHMLIARKRVLKQRKQEQSQ